MESLRNAASVAASYVGLETTTDETNTSNSHIGGGEAPQNTLSSNTQSGVEPVSGVRGAGTAAEPFDAGNRDDNAGAATSARSNPTGGAAPQHTSAFSGTQSGTEPISGIRGPGTAGQPFDAGNNESMTSRIGSGRDGQSGNSRTGPSNQLGSGSSGYIGGNSSSTSKTTLGHDTDSTKFGSQLGSDIARSTNNGESSHVFDQRTAPGAGGVGVNNDHLTNRSIENMGSGLKGVQAGLASDRSAGAGTNSGAGLGSGNSTTRSIGDAVITGTERGTSTRGSGREEFNAIGGSNTRGQGLMDKAEQKNAAHMPSSAANDASRSSGARGSAATDESSRTFTTGDASRDSAPTQGGRDARDTRDLPLRTKEIAAAAVVNHGQDHGHGHGHGASQGGQVTGYTDEVDGGCDQEAHGYEPHGGHPTGEGAHVDGHAKPTFLQWRGEQNNPLGQAK